MNSNCCNNSNCFPSPTCPPPQGCVSSSGCPLPQCGSCCYPGTPPFTRPDCRYPPPPYEFCVSYSKFSGEMEEHRCIVTDKGIR